MIFFLFIIAIFTDIYLSITNLLIVSVLHLNNCPFRLLVLITGTVSIIIRYHYLHILIIYAVTAIKEILSYREVILDKNIGGKH